MWSLLTSKSFFFFPFIYISWKLITLQYCSGFGHTLTWISHGFTCVPHPKTPPTSLPTPSLWVILVHQPWALVSCIKPGLEICFTINNIHVSSKSYTWNLSAGKSFRNENTLILSTLIPEVCTEEAGWMPQDFFLLCLRFQGQLRPREHLILSKHLEALLGPVVMVSWALYELEFTFTH